VKLPEERMTFISKICGDAGIQIRKLRIAID
jgi:hypothetical protein